MKHRTTYHTCKLRESLYIHYTQPRRGNRGLPAVLGSNSWDQCVTVRQQVEELYLPGALFTHAPLILICLCAALHPHHHNHFSRFITPTTSSLQCPNIKTLLWFCNMISCVSRAGRCIVDFPCISLTILRCALWGCGCTYPAGECLALLASNGLPDSSLWRAANQTEHS